MSGRISTLAFTLNYSGGESFYNTISKNCRRCSICIAKLFVYILYNRPERIRIEFKQQIDRHSRKLFTLECMRVGLFNMNGGVDVYTFGMNFKYKSGRDYIP